MKDYLTDFYNEDMHKIISQDLSRNNKNYDGILNNIINHAGYIYSKLRKTKSSIHSKSIYGTINHWVTEISTGIFDLSSNKTIQGLISKNESKVLENHFDNLTEDLAKINKILQKEDQSYVPEDELRNFYQAFRLELISRIWYLGPILKSKSVDSMNKSEKNELYEIISDYIFSFYRSYLGLH